jgi:hypothetical protein
MGVKVGTGAILAIASTYGTTVAMSAITNATEAVATLAASHGVVVGDYLEITSGWGDLNGKIVRAKIVSTNDVTLETINTTSTTNYPTGTGTGSIRRITAWTNLSQIKSLEMSGGDLNTTDISGLSDKNDISIPTSRSAVQLKVTVFEDPTLTWYATVQSADTGRVPVGFRMTDTLGIKTLANAYWAIAQVPVYSRNEAVTRSIDLTFSAAPVIYTT